MSSYLFRNDYRGIEEKSAELSASPFVDAAVAVGRFFYLPNHLFVALERVLSYLVDEKHVVESLSKVDDFIAEVVNHAEEGGSDFPSRLLSNGISRDEVRAQCKDLMFAGTDSTGMNLATIFRMLALHPEK